MSYFLGGPKDPVKGKNLLAKTLDKKLKQLLINENNKDPGS